MESEKKTGVMLLVAGVLILVGMVLFTAPLWINAANDVQLPMPCMEGQVYVWSDYPNEAKCVGENDHSLHTSATEHTGTTHTGATHDGS